MFPTMRSPAFRQTCCCLLIVLCAASHAPAADQLPIDRVEQMPNLPSPYAMRDWPRVARDYVDFLLVPNQPLPSYIGAAGGPEALNLVAAVVSGSLVGRDMRTFRNFDWVRLCHGYFTEEDGICSNGLHGRTGGSFWYDIFANVLFYQLADRYPGNDAALRRIADQCAAVNDFNHTAFNFHIMKPFDNGRRVEPEAGAGIAWIEYAAWRKFHDQKYLDAADRALRNLESYPVEKSPLYEVLLPYGALTAARLNAEQQRPHDTARWLNWCFAPAKAGARPYWGVIADRFGDCDCHGLVGSVKDTDGYAFAMNTFQWAGALTPLPRYDPRYARAIGKWILNLANASRLFYPNALPASHQDNRDWADANDRAYCIAYEGLRKHPRAAASPSPFATGDVMKKGRPLNLCLYGSSHVGILGAIVRRTDDPKILQLDCLATDYFRDNAYPTFLYYNPCADPREIKPPPGRLYDAVSHQFLDRLIIPPDSARLIVVTPPDGKLERRNRQTLVNGTIIDYAAD